MPKYFLIASLIGAIQAQAQPELQEEMHERFSRATMVQTALINGQLEDARQWARQLAAIAPRTDDFGDIRSLFGHFATQIAESETIHEAALATGRLANACGSCHELFGVPPYRFESSVHEPGGESVPERMNRHIWAADRLWEGLVGRVEGAWADGASMLMEAPLTSDQITGDGDQRVEALARQVHDTGREAMETVRWDARGRLYATLLTTCADCHQAYRNAGPDSAADQQ